MEVKFIHDVKHTVCFCVSVSETECDFNTGITFIHWITCM